MRTFSYVGSPDFLPKGDFPPRFEITDAAVLREWMESHRNELDLEECIAATYVVDQQLRFWIADRATEHVACARLEPVLSAGEVFFSGLGDEPYVERITNQSTGFCPDPESWELVKAALAKTGLSFPEEFDPAFVFRRCKACDTLAIIKDDDFSCLVCGSDLSES